MRRPLCLVCLIFVILIIGIVEIFPYEYDFPNDLSGEVVLVEGKVSKKETKEKNGQTIYYIYLEQIMLQSDSNADNVGDRDSKIQKLNMAEGILCYMEENSYIPNIGSRVQISGEISVFEKPDNPGEFNTALYYKIKGIDLKMYDCELVAYTENYDVIVEKLFRLKESLCNILDNCFRYEYRGIAKAILLGMSGEVDEDTKELYQRNGMLHILCVSGVNTLNLVSLSKPQMPNLRAFPQVLLRKYTLFYQQILSGFCPLVVLPLFRGCFSKLTKWQKEYLFAKV